MIKYGLLTFINLNKVKTIAIIIFLTAMIVAQPYAKCRNSGLKVYPQSNTISGNSNFLIEGYATTQSIIGELNKKYPIYLESENHRVTLNVIETNSGMFHKKQAMLEL